MCVHMVLSTILAANENIPVEQYIQRIMEDYAKKLPLGEAVTSPQTGD